MTLKAIEVYAELTPNPRVMKYVCSQAINSGESKEYSADQSSATGVPLCDLLLGLPFVEGVFVAKNFIAITKRDTIEWDMVGQELRSLVQDTLRSNPDALKGLNSAQSHLSEGQGTEDTTVPLSQEVQHAAPKGEVEEKIVSILDEYINPSVARDGGQIVFSSFQEGTLYLTMKGACAGCPSSTQTLKQGIQNLFEEMMPEEVLEIEEATI